VISWIVGKVLRKQIALLTKGDTAALLRSFAPDAHLVFPGDNSFSGDHRGKEAIGAWLERFAALHPRFTIHDVGVAGTPWNMRVFFRFSDQIALPGGGGYANEGMELMRLRWGKIREQRVYLDTEKVRKLDTQLAPAEV
jgi:ketosteroid isomerase-like protein